MNDSQNEPKKITIDLSMTVLRQVDRIAREKNLTRDKVINDILEDHFSGDEDWIEDIIR